MSRFRSHPPKSKQTKEVYVEKIIAEFRVSNHPFVCPTHHPLTEAATPMNTPLNAAPISGRDGLPQPSVATIGESAEEDGDEQQGGNPASVLARVSHEFHCG